MQVERKSLISGPFFLLHHPKKSINHLIKSCCHQKLFLRESIFVFGDSKKRKEKKSDQLSHTHSKYSVTFLPSGK